MLSGPVALRDEPDEGLGRLAQDVAGARDPLGAIALVERHPDAFPLPGRGSTLSLWESLATVASTSLTAARSVEPHLDALAILDEARRAGHAVPAVPQGSSWGVFAAEGPGTRLTAEGPDTHTRLTGDKPWCSLADRLSHALVTAWDSDTTRRLYAVELGPANHVAVRPATWAARGLSDVPSGPVAFAGSGGSPVGPTGWYLERPGFAWGGMGVAAIWYGGAVGVARRLIGGGREPDQVALMHVGAVDATLWAARAVLVDAAARIDGGRAEGIEGAVFALRVRRVVASAAEDVLERVAHASGPAPLALEEDHARRVADLQLYVRQEHAERDAAALGRTLTGHDDVTRPPW
ncbi:acyl-CoA dehydrogenase [Terrabacter sp. 2RAF25]|uniref:acyl-CoA dehydrogenase n=1 Tax=Terrabacter sp. 2RAF25 TaxID=3232998 RepID=UPI003F9C8621